MNEDKKQIIALLAVIEKVHRTIRELRDQDLPALRQEILHLIGERDTAHAEAALLREALAHVEYGLGADENSYCLWCAGEEPGNKPDSTLYDDPEELEFALARWQERGHKPDCRRQAALATDVGAKALAVIEVAKKHNAAEHEMMFRFDTEGIDPNDKVIFDFYATMRDLDVALKALATT